MVKADISDVNLVSWSKCREEITKAVRARINAMTFSGSIEKARMYKKLKPKKFPEYLQSILRKFYS